jgi:uncharacterized membrane protein YeaQ/YmgE (transglycosylase-associated protein family)
MSIIAWIILGLVAGFIASKIVNGHGEGIFLDIIGIVGALIGGWISAARASQGFNLCSLLVAIGGAVVLLVIGHPVRRAL